ncbi:MAG: hypothetical protein QNJ30_08610 [Kiloniellales bacterium]|nr:hypothetical protein [Kiloniellales bacterium]
MNLPSYEIFSRFLRTPNVFLYLISKKIDVETVFLISLYCGAVWGFLRAVALRPLDVPYIFLSRDSFPSNSYAVEWATNSWSLIHQIGYLGYSLGLGHGQMSAAISAAAGAAMVAGLALLLYSISKNGLLAVLLAPLIARDGFFSIFESDYPTQYIGSEHLSWLGSSFAILTLGVAAVGYFRSTGFLAVLTTCIHLILGLWTVIIVAFIAAFLLLKERREKCSAILRGLSLGTLFLFGSYLVDHFVFTTKSEFSADDHAFLIWSQFWGHHRNIDFKILPIISAFICGAMMLWLHVLKETQGLYHGSSITLALSFAVVLSPLPYIISHSDLGAASEIMVRAIPGRFMMFNVFFVQVFFIGTLFRFSFRRMCQNRSASFALITLLMYSFVLGLYIEVRNHEIMLFWIFVFVILLVSAARFTQRPRPRSRLFVRATNVVIAVAFFAGTVSLTALSYIGFERAASYGDTNECRDVELKGLVLVASYRQFAISQRLCALPALIDPTATNSLPYIPWAASEMRRIISIAYGVSFENPPVATRYRGAIVKSAFKQVWEARTAAEWVHVANEFGVDAVMVPPDWVLALKQPIAEGDSYKLYSLR